jgi:hypothetical protein
MAPSAIDPRIVGQLLSHDQRHRFKLTLSAYVDVVQPRKDTLGLPGPTKARLDKAGIDLSNGYPERPAAPMYLDDAYKIRGEPWE